MSMQEVYPLEVLDVSPFSSGCIHTVLMMSVEGGVPPAVEGAPHQDLGHQAAPTHGDPDEPKGEFLI